MISGCGERKRVRECESARETSVAVTAWLRKFPGALATNPDRSPEIGQKSSSRPDPFAFALPCARTSTRPYPYAPTEHHLHIQARAFLLSTVILLSAAFYMSYHFTSEFRYVTRDHSILAVAKRGLKPSIMAMHVRLSQPPSPTPDVQRRRAGINSLWRKQSVSSPTSSINCVPSSI